MDNKSIAKVLEQLGVMVELSGGNMFKARAHYSAARTAETLAEPIIGLVEKEELGKVKGFGKGLVDKVNELVRTGEITEFNELKSTLPDGLFEMLRIPGMGPKKVRAVYEKLGISTIGELQYACNENRLAILDGFGKKTQDNIIQGIEQLQSYRDYHLFPDAIETADSIIHNVRSFDGVSRAEIAGSLRRRKDSVKDIDIIAAVEDSEREKVSKKFTHMEDVTDIIGSGNTKTSVRIRGSINVDLRLVTEQEFPFALHHFTGSKEHNTSMRGIAKSAGLKMNEYGIFRENSDTSIECLNEKDIFDTLKMQYIKPELRESLGEIEAAQSNELPDLITAEDILGVIHVHTTYSDGRNTLEEMVKACEDDGYEYIGISDHSRSAFYANGLTEERIIEQHREIDELQDKYPNTRIFKGIESDILGDGSLDYSDDILKSFDFVIASVHSKLKMTVEEATERLLKAIRNPYTTMLGHPTGRLLLSREGYPLDWDQLLDAAAEHNVIMELNANPFRLDIDSAVCREASKRGIGISINPDAHKLEGIGDIKYGINTARRGWLERKDVVCASGADDFAKWITKNR